MSRFGDGGPARCSMGPKLWLGRVVFSPKSPFLRVLSGTFLASSVTHEAGISGWNGSYGSMQPKWHIRRLDLAMGGLPGAQWVQIDGLRGSFLAHKIPISEGVERHVLGLQCHQSYCNFWLEWFIRINGT